MNKTLLLSLLVCSLFIVGCTQLALPSEKDLCQNQEKSSLAKEAHSFLMQFQGQYVPSELKLALKNQNINLYITASKDPVCKGKIAALSLIVEDGKVTSVNNKMHYAPTFHMATSEKVFTAIMRSQNPGAAFQSAYDKDLIELSAKGVFDSLKLKVASLFMPEPKEPIVFEQDDFEPEFVEIEDRESNQEEPANEDEQQEEPEQEVEPEVVDEQLEPVTVPEYDYTALVDYSPNAGFREVDFQAFEEVELEECGEPQGGWQAHTTYTLIQDVESNNNCFEIDVGNIIFDGNGHSITSISDRNGVNVKGIVVSGPSNVLIKDTTFSNTGISLTAGSIMVTVQNNIFENGAGILLRDVFDNRIETNTFLGDDEGTAITLRGASLNKILSNQIERYSVGISASENSFNNYLQLNSISNGQDGITVLNSPGVIVKDSPLEGLEGSAIRVIDSDGVVLRDNAIRGSGSVQVRGRDNMDTPAVRVFRSRGVVVFNNEFEENVGVALEIAESSHHAVEGGFHPSVVENTFRDNTQNALKVDAHDLIISSNLFENNEGAMSLFIDNSFVLDNEVQENDAGILLINHGREAAEVLFKDNTVCANRDSDIQIELYDVPNAFSAGPIVLLDGSTDNQIDQVEIVRGENAEGSLVEGEHYELCE